VKPFCIFCMERFMKNSLVEKNLPSTIADCVPGLFAYV